MIPGHITLAQLALELGRHPHALRRLIEARGWSHHRVGTQGGRGVRRGRVCFTPAEADRIRRELTEPRQIGGGE